MLHLEAHHLSFRNRLVHQSKVSREPVFASNPRAECGGIRAKWRKEGGWEGVGEATSPVQVSYRDEAQVEIVNPRAESHVFHLPST